LGQNFMDGFFLSAGRERWILRICFVMTCSVEWEWHFGGSSKNKTGTKDFRRYVLIFGYKMSRRSGANRSIAADNSYRYASLMSPAKGETWILIKDKHLCVYYIAKS
jgi:hypothetical protein